MASQAQEKIFTYKIKALILVILVITSIFLLRFSPVSVYLQPQRIKDFIGNAGYLAPLVFIVSYAVGICFFLPATLFTGIGAMLFGTLMGFMYNIAGAMLGASAAFFIGRYLGRDFAASLIGNNLVKYNRRFESDGFSVTLYLRLVFFPFTPLNFGMGLTRVTFRQYFWGTFLGILAGGFVMTFFFATLTEIWNSGEWQRLWNWKSLLSVALFIGSFFIPRVVRNFKPDPAVPKPQVSNSDQAG